MVNYQDVSTAKLAELAAIILGKTKGAVAALEEVGAELLTRLEQPLDAETVAAWLLDDARTEEEIAATGGVWLDKVVDELDPPTTPAEPPTVPAEPVNPDGFEVVNTVTLDPTESEYDQAKRIASSWGRGTMIVVPNGESVAPIRFGSGFLAGFADGSPVRDVAVAGFGTVRGVEIHPAVGGRLIFNDVTIQPMHENDKAPVRTIGACYDAALEFYGVATESPYDGFDGFGMMWGMTTIGCSVKLQDVSFGAAKEHGLYAMNSRGIEAVRVTNRTRLLGVGGLELGMGRTLLSHQNRVDDAIGAIGGSPSVGFVRFTECVAHRCGHEGLIHGGPPSGGSDFTVGGHTDTVVMRDIRSVDPFCGGIAVWNEKAKGKQPRAWQIDGDGNIWNPNPSGDIGWGIDALIVEGYTQTRSDVPLGRTPILVGGCGSVQMSGIGDLEYEIDHRDDVPPCGSVSITP